MPVGAPARARRPPGGARGATAAARTALARWPPPPAGAAHARVYLLLGAAVISFSSIFVRLSGASPSTAAIFRCAYALPALGLFAWWEGRRHGPRVWRERRFAIAAGALFALDLILWHNSIADVGAGLATVLANVQVVLLPLAAWALLHERPTRRTLLALPVAMVGVLLISGALEAHAYGRAPTRGALFGLGAGVAYVGFLMLFRRSGVDLRRPAGPLFDVTATATVLCIGAGIVIGDARLVPSWPSAGWLLALALSSQVLGWLLISVSLPRLPPAMSSLLLACQLLATLFAAAAIFGEAPSVLQLLGVVALLGALLGVVASRRRAAPPT